MALKRIHVALSTSQMKDLDRIARKLGLDRTSTIRYCIARISEIELAPKDVGAGR